MTDPVNGCPRCGLATCPFPAADAARMAMGDAKNNEWSPEQWAAIKAYRAADDDCHSRPAVDWQAVARTTLADRDEQAQHAARLSALLEATANALKGPPSELQLHGWADLPAFAAALVEERDRIAAQFAASQEHEEGMRAALIRVQSEHAKFDHGDECSASACIGDCNEDGCGEHVCDCCKSVEALIDAFLAASPVARSPVTPEMAIALLRAVGRLTVGDFVSIARRHLSAVEEGQLVVKVRDRGLFWFLSREDVPYIAIRRDLATLVIKHAWLAGEGGTL